jgi:hypothetical protein
MGSLLMVARVQNRLRRFQFEQISRKILQTPPISVKPGPLRIVSMVRNTDLYMYLGAIKSLYRAVGEGAVTAVNDGSLTAPMIDTLRAHIPGVTVVNIDDIDTGRCPRGGTWERLVLIMKYTQDAYVIQMDADTLACGTLEYVVRSYGQNRSFGLGTSVGKDVVPAHVISEWASAIAGLDVTLVAERALVNLPESQRLRYIRGSSGFAGFARGAFSLTALENFSEQMRNMIGSKWDEWGSEQVASNFTIANAPGATVLPFPGYSCYYPHLPIDYTSNEFIHFIGTHRYQNGFYAAKMNALARSLRSA